MNSSIHIDHFKWFDGRRRTKGVLVGQQEPHLSTQRSESQGIPCLYVKNYGPN
jgi:hypothetical protein